MPHNSAAKKGFDTETYKRVNTADYWHTKNEEKSVSEEVELMKEQSHLQHARSGTV